jgi:hypothetical protein
MAETYTELETTFTTADTEGHVAMILRENMLKIEFSNFRTPIQTVIFHHVRAFTWTGWEGTSEKISPDRIYQVAGSELLAPFTRFAVNGAPFLHFKLGFNAEAKFLDVVSTRMEYVSV